ncbi:hypothetical protein ACEWUX_21435, partial [Klebsiella pneumoniae]
MKQDVGGKEAEEITANGTVPADQFTWHPVSRAVGNVKTKGPELIENSRAFRILCHVKNSTASSLYSAVLQNKWLTAT